MGVFQNNLLAGAAAAASAGGAAFYDHQIEQSVRIEAGGNQGFNRANGTPTNNKKATLSIWVKRTDIGNTGYDALWKAFTSGTGGTNIGFDLGGGDDTLSVGVNPSYDAPTAGSSSGVFRDTGGWNHIVIAFDTTDGTNANRVKVYLNGSEIDSFDGTVAQNEVVAFVNSSTDLYIGRSEGSSSNSLGAYLAEAVIIDGTAYGADSFGETKNGVWIPKDPSGLTFGNNGAYLKFENASDLGNDSSGNNNDFTANGLGTDHQVLDSPTFGS